jgi:autotransporter-associated beta strand protein
MKSRTQQFHGRKLSGRIILHFSLLAALLCAGGAAAQDGYWVNSGGGSWANSGNWDRADGIAAGTDDTAYFGFGREAAIAPNASFTFDGTQTIGNLVFTTQGGPASWSFNPGAGGSLTLDNTFGLPEITVASSSLQVSVNAVVTGLNGVEKDGAGVLALGADNTYNGLTLVMGGELKVTGSVGTGGVEVANGTLSGNGVILGPVVVDSGGAFSPGNTSGPLTISNSLVLLPGSTTLVTINRSGQVPVRGLSSVTYGGTLVLNNLSGALSLGQSFSLFASASASGNFTSIVPPPGPWLRWRFDPATGQISVVSSASQPAFSSAGRAGGNFIARVSNGPPGSPGYIMACSDLNQPWTAWKQIATNVFDMSGDCTFTNAIDANGARQMYYSIFVIPSP